METNNNSNLPIKPEEVNNIIQTIPAILQRNDMSVLNCNKAGKALLDTIEGSQGIDSDELDTVVSDYISKVKVTVANMNERRKPITQMLTAVGKMFTTMENQIDIKAAGTIPFKLQEARNKYAAKKLAEQKKREEEARRRQMVENEKAQYRADISLLLDTTYANYVAKHINALNSMYSCASLETYNDACRQIKEAGISFVWADFVKNVLDNNQTFYMDGKARTEIKNEVALLKKKEYTERYSFEMEDLKQSLIDRLPSLRKELEEREELRRTNAAEAARMEGERQQREVEERRKQNEDRRRREEEAKAKAEAEKAAAEVQAAFNFSADSIPVTPTKAKVKKIIEITNPQGFLQVYQMWFTREGINLPMDELEKVHKKMISYCEKVMNKDGEQIQSAYVKYVDDVTAK